jgi:lysophospholipase L1-like esterase
MKTLSTIILTTILAACGGSGVTPIPTVAHTPAIEEPALVAEPAPAPTPDATPTPALTLIVPPGLTGTQHIISYGQSLSLGERSVNAFPSDNGIPSDYQDVGLMFSDGVRSVGTLPLVSFRESTTSFDATTLYVPTGGETPLYGALLALKGLPGTRIGSAAGRGGTPIAELSKGTAPYTRLLTQVVNAKAQATPPYTVPAIIWMQGEADPFNANYATNLAQLVADLNSDIKSITGQAMPVHFHICLTSYAVPAAAQQELASAIPNIVHIACDTATLRRSDGVHLSAAGSRDAGMALGASIAKSW